jgi:hypothetical protein
MFINPPGVINYRPLRVDVGDQHLYWQSTYQHLLRVEGAFGEFFPQAEFSDGGNQVIFTKYVEGVEVMSRTRALRAGECIPHREWVRFLTTWQSFKRQAERTDIPEDFRSFIRKFSPPSIELYPSAYRIYRPHWYSRPRLFILWGLEPVGGSDFNPENVVAQIGNRAELQADANRGQFILWLKIAGIFLLFFLALLLVLWFCLPRPIVDFEANPYVNRVSKVQNKTKLDQDWVWGLTSYDWSFSAGSPSIAKDYEPEVVWTKTGLVDVTLQVTQSTLWGLLYKSESKTSAILVKPVPVIPEAKKGKTGISGENRNSDNFPDAKLTDEKSKGNKYDDKKEPNPGAGGEKSSGFNPQPVPGEVTPKSGTDATNPRKDDKGALTPGSSEGVGKTNPTKNNPSGLNSNGNSVGQAHVPMRDAGQKASGSNADSPVNKMNQEKAGSSRGDSKQGTADAPSSLTADAAKTTPKADNGSSKSANSPNGGEAGGNPMRPDSGQSSKPDLGNRPSEMNQNGDSTGGGSPGGLGNSGKGNSPGKASGDSQQSGSPMENSPADNRSQTPVEPRVIKPSADSTARVLNPPQLSVTKESIVDDGKAQQIEFTVSPSAGTKVERVTIDGDEVAVSSSGKFNKLLTAGKHDIRLEYGSVSSEVHESVNIPLTVDADKVIKPKNSLGPAIKAPAKDLGTPGESNPEANPATPLTPTKFKTESA